MLNNYYTSEGKYIEYMSGSDICESTNMKTLTFRNHVFGGLRFWNERSYLELPSEHIISTLPNNAAISSINFKITSTDQGKGTNDDGTQYEIVLRYGNIDYPLTNKLWCVNFKTYKYIARNREVLDVFRFQPFIKTNDTDVKLIFKLYNLGPDHKATILGYTIVVEYFN